MGLASRSPFQRTSASERMQNAIEQNKQHLRSLEVGKHQEDVKEIMGGPDGSDFYFWGSMWLSRTAMVSGVSEGADSDFTSVVFDASGKLLGWGRDALIRHTKPWEQRSK